MDKCNKKHEKYSVNILIHPIKSSTIIIEISHDYDCQRLCTICFENIYKVKRSYVFYSTDKHKHVICFRILVIGTSHGWFKKINTRIHIDQILEACAQECQKLERLEIQWDEETLRWNENSSKFIDHIR